MVINESTMGWYRYMGGIKMDGNRIMKRRFECELTGASFTSTGFCEGVYLGALCPGRKKLRPRRDATARCSFL